MRTKTIQIDSINIRYADEGTGKPLLLIHGFPETLLGWRKNIPELAKHFRVLAPDVVGFGRSDKVDWDYSVSGLARFAKKFLDALRIAKTHVIGTDTGASIALGLAADYPESVEKLVLFSGTGYSRSISAPEVKLMMCPVIGDVIFLLFGGLGTRLGILRSFYDFKRIDWKIVQEYVDCLSTLKARKIAVRLMRELEKTASTPLLKLKQKCPPTLILWARHESFFYSWVPDKLHEDLQGSALQYIEDAGHFLQEEQPAIFNAMVLEFLRTQA